MIGLEKAISWQRYKWSTIMKVPGKSANEPTWFQFLSQVCSFYGVGAVKAGKKVVDNRGLTLISLITCYLNEAIIIDHTSTMAVQLTVKIPVLLLVGGIPKLSNASTSTLCITPLKPVNTPAVVTTPESRSTTYGTLLDSIRK